MNKRRENVAGLRVMKIMHGKLPDFGWCMCGRLLEWDYLILCARRWLAGVYVLVASQAVDKLSIKV